MECSWIEVPPGGRAMDVAAHARPAEAGTPAEKIHAPTMVRAWVGVPPSGGREGTWPLTQAR